MALPLTLQNVHFVQIWELLGHIVCHDDLLVDPHNITTIIAMLTPTNVMEIKWFLGAVGFYWCYLWNFASKAAPMCKLLKKDEKIIWIKACAKSWEWMKASMTCLPILIVLDWKLEFHVHIDASNFAFGTMLSQNMNKTIDKSIYYANRFMNNEKNNYTTIKKEN